MIDALIVEDEALARRGMRQLLASHADIHVVAECRNGAEALAQLGSADIQLLFLDIQMPLLSGFDVVREMRAAPAVIFLTAYEEFALDAFDVDAVDYLVKPVEQQRFDNALARARRWLAGSRSPADLKQGLSQLVVQVGDTTRVIPVDEILWIGADDYYAVINTSERRYLLRETLTSLEERLDPSRFVRIHRSAIVNLSAVRELRHDDEDVVVLRNGTRLPISRRRRARFAERISM